MNKIKISFLSVIMALAIAMPVSASQDTNKVEAEVGPGQLSLKVPGVNGFSKDISIKKTAQSYPTGFDDSFNVQDFTGGDGKWDLRVKASNFSSNKNSYSDVIYLNPPKSITKVSHTVPGASSKKLNSKTVLTDSSLSVVGFDKDGNGEFDVSFGSDALILDVLPTMKEGSYSSTLTWELVGTP